MKTSQRLSTRTKSALKRQRLRWFPVQQTRPRGPVQPTPASTLFKYTSAAVIPVNATIADRKDIMVRTALNSAHAVTECRDTRAICAAQQLTNHKHMHHHRATLIGEILAGVGTEAVAVDNGAGIEEGFYQLVTPTTTIHMMTTTTQMALTATMKNSTPIITPQIRPQLFQMKSINSRKSSIKKKQRPKKESLGKRQGLLMDLVQVVGGRVLQCWQWWPASWSARRRRQLVHKNASALSTLGGPFGASPPRPSGITVPTRLF